MGQPKQDVPMWLDADLKSVAEEKEQQNEKGAMVLEGGYEGVVTRTRSIKSQKFTSKFQDNK